MVKYLVLRSIRIGDQEFAKGDELDASKMDISKKRIRMMLDAKKIAESGKS